MSMSFDDGAIDAGGEAEVICVDDQAAHRVSLAGQRVVSRDGGRTLVLTAFSPLAYTRKSADGADFPQSSTTRVALALNKSEALGRTGRPAQSVAHEAMRGG